MIPVLSQMESVRLVYRPYLGRRPFVRVYFWRTIWKLFCHRFHCLAKLISLRSRFPGVSFVYVKVFAVLAIANHVAGPMTARRVR